MSSYWALSDQGQGHDMTSKFFSIYHNTNCQVLYLSSGTWQEVVFKYVCSSDAKYIKFMNIVTLE